MKDCTYGATPWSKLIDRPLELRSVRGSDGEDEGAKPKDEQGDDDEDGAKPGSEKESKEGKNDEDEDLSGETVESLNRKFKNSEEARNRAVDKRDEYKRQLGEANDKIKQMEKDGTPDDAIKNRNKELETTNATLASTNQRLMLQIAMRDDKAHVWVDPDAALKLADLSEVEFDEKTLKPIGFKAALDKLAKEKPYLLKPKDEDEEGKGGNRSGAGRPPAGGGRGKPRDQTAKAAREAELRQRYAGLRR